MRKIVLASTSPQRKMLMELLKIPFDIEASNYEEDMTLDLSPEELVKELSYGKALDVAQKFSDAVIIGADCIVAFDNKVVGKPHTVEKAMEILSKLNGRMHSVFTGFTIIDTETNTVIKEAVETKVYFKSLTDEEIMNYIKLDTPLQNAGAYKIQSLGGILVERIEGDFNNVVGLPIAKLVDCLKEVGINVL